MGCASYFTVAFRATGDINLICELAKEHTGPHLDRTRVYWSVDLPTIQANGSE